MNLFSISPGGECLSLSVPSLYHGDFQFTLSTLAAGDLSIRNEERRGPYLESAGISMERVAFFYQTHSKQVAEIGRGFRNPIHADGAITGDPSLVLAITVADCIPIALFDRENGAFALVHSGWKGTGIAVVALEMMRHSFGTRPCNVYAVIGPGIGSCCYNVPRQRAADFSSYGDKVVCRRDGDAYLDLKEANRVLLSEQGVTDIDVSSRCTRCSDNLGSYRRQGPGEFTSMLAVVGHF